MDEDSIDRRRRRGRTTTTTTIISEGGRPASTRVVSPYGGPVNTGKPGIWLAPSCLGFSRSPLPALRRQASPCAWRSRLRRRCPTGGQDVAAGVPKSGPEAILGRRWPPNLSPGGPVPESLGCLGGPGAHRPVQEAHRSRTERCEIRYAQCHFAHIEALMSIMLSTVC